MAFGFFLQAVDEEVAVDQVIEFAVGPKALFVFELIWVEEFGFEAPAGEAAFEVEQLCLLGVVSTAEDAEALGLLAGPVGGISGQEGLPEGPHIGAIVLLEFCDGRGAQVEASAVGGDGMGGGDIRIGLHGGYGSVQLQGPEFSLRGPAVHAGGSEARGRAGVYEGFFKGGEGAPNRF